LDFFGFSRKNRHAGGGSRTHTHREVNLILSPERFYKLLFLKPLNLKSFIINCAQTVPKNIKKYRNPKSLVFLCFTEEILYFLCFLFFPSNIHTVEITGSNPVLPTTFFSTT
jgi:hypothetical protein